LNERFFNTLANHGWSLIQLKRNAGLPTIGFKLYGDRLNNAALEFDRSGRKGQITKTMAGSPQSSSKAPG
jgi:hypothetical protein